MARECAVAVDDEGATVENEFVLPSDLIDIDERKAGLAGPFTRQGKTLMEFPYFERRAVGNQEQFCACSCKV